MDLNYDYVKYKNKKYAIIRIGYKGIDLPIIIDFKDLSTFKRMNRNLKTKWKYNKNGSVACCHTYKGATKNIYFHEIVMALMCQENNMKPLDRPIIHINNIGLDNRRDNLVYDTTNKYTNKNVHKKSRTITLPPSCGINPDDIPTYVWYMKPNKSHGERFMISVGETKWKTTSSKKCTLKYKLEEAKTFLRNLKKEKPGLFCEYSMNGDYTKTGKKFIDSYYDIIYQVGYNHIPRYIHKNKTKDYLKPGKFTRKERILLKQQKKYFGGGEKNRRIKNNLPKECGITSNDLPKYCYYRPPYKGRGGYFVINNHPKLDKKIWQTTSSKKISVIDKYQQLLDQLKSHA